MMTIQLRMATVSPLHNTFRQFSIVSSPKGAHSSLIRAHYGHTEAAPQVDGRQYQYMAIYRAIAIPVPAQDEPFVRISLGCKGPIGTVLFRLAHAELPQGNRISIVTRLV